MQFRKLSRGLKAAYRESNVAGRVRHFNGWLDRASAGGDGDGASAYDHADTVREYYDLSSDLMVTTWGESLHFAPLSPRESLEESKARHQRRMIARLELREGMTVIDVGCGIGGPMRRVVREGGVRVVGVNSSAVQLERAKALNAEAGIGGMAEFHEGSFMDMSAFADGAFDRGYAIESTCHAPDKAAAFAEIHRVLKPGALFWGQEMCLTDRFDPDDEEHQAIKRDLMHGIALREIATTREVDRDLEAAGFEVIEGADMDVTEGDPATPWYQPLTAWDNTPIGALRGTWLGRKTLVKASRLAEALGALPKGSSQVVGLLEGTRNAYVAGGRTGIFTPLYCFLARKPL